MTSGANAISASGGAIVVKALSSFDIGVDSIGVDSISVDSIGVDSIGVDSIGVDTIGLVIMLNHYLSILSRRSLLI